MWVQVRAQEREHTAEAVAIATAEVNAALTAAGSETIASLSAEHEQALCAAQAAADSRVSEAEGRLETAHAAAVGVYRTELAALQASSSAALEGQRRAHEETLAEAVTSHHVPKPRYLQILLLCAGQ